MEKLWSFYRRYVEFVSALVAPHTGIRQLEKVVRPVRHEGRNYRGFNLLHGQDLALFQTIVRREFAISGLRNRDLQVRLNKTLGQVSHLLKCLRLHVLIKKIGRTYKYYLTRLGQAVVACALRLRQTTVPLALGDLAYA